MEVIDGGENGGTEENVGPTGTPLASRRQSVVYAFWRFGAGGHGRQPRRQRLTQPTRFCCVAICCRPAGKELIRCCGRCCGGRVEDAWRPVRSVAAASRGGNGDHLERNAFGSPGRRVFKTERRRLVQTVKGLDIPVAGTMGFRKAEVTAGGVALEEVDSRPCKAASCPTLFCRGTARPQRSDRRIQFSGRVQHRLVGGRKRVRKDGKKQKRGPSVMQFIEWKLAL